MSSHEDGSNADLTGHQFPQRPAESDQSTTRPPQDDDIRMIDEARQRGREMETSAPSRTASPTSTGEGGQSPVEVPGFQILQSMMASSLFSDYLHYRAVRTHDLPELEQRVYRFCLDHRILSWFCTMLDMLTRLLVWIAVYAVLVSIAGAMVYKTFISDVVPHESP